MMIVHDLEYVEEMGKKRQDPRGYAEATATKEAAFWREHDRLLWRFYGKRPAKADPKDKP